MSVLLYAASAVLDFPAAPLPQALDRLAQVMGLQIKKPERISEQIAPALKGDYTAQEALTHLLADSGFQAQKTEQSRYLVQASESAGRVQQLPEMTVTGASANPEFSGYTTNRADSLTRTDLPLSDIPVSIQVVPHEVLRGRAVSQPGQLLENVSGVQTEASYGGNRGMFFNIRGFTTHSSSRDGFQYNGNLVTRDVQNIERIEVMKGPSGTLYGGVGSLGGQVNTVSKRPLDYNYGAINLLWVSYQQWRPTFDITFWVKGFP